MTDTTDPAAVAAELREVAKRFRAHGIDCTDCGGDCASANPPVSCCPVRAWLDDCDAVASAASLLEAFAVRSAEAETQRDAAIDHAEKVKAKCDDFVADLVNEGAQFRAELSAAAAEIAALKRLEWFARKVLEKFAKDEAQGYRSRDRQYAIDMLGRCLPPLPETSESGGGGDV